MSSQNNLQKQNRTGEVELAPAPSRSLWIDVAKGIGIILVVFGHVARGIYLDQKYDWGRFLDLSIYMFHMPLFFLLSGTVHPRSLKRHGPARLLAIRFDTLIYPFLLWSYLHIFVQRIAPPGAVNRLVDIPTFKELILWPPLQMWFVLVLMIAVTLQVVGDRLARGRGWILTLAVSIPFWASPDLTSMGVVFWYCSFHIVFFSLGCLFGERTSARHGARALAWAAAYSAGLLVLRSQGYWLERMWWFRIPCGLFGVLFVCELSRFIAHSRLSWILAYLGRASFPVYLMHLLVAATVRMGLNRAGIHDPFVQVLLGTILGVAVPVLVSRALERLNFTFLFCAPHWLSAKCWLDKLATPK